jgi:homoserine dehydrogenase
VVADLVDVGLNLKFGSHRRVPAFRIGPQFRKITPMEDIKSRYYLRLQVADRPGVIARTAELLSSSNINLSSITQHEGQSSDNVTVLITTHSALESDITKVVEAIEKMPEIQDKIKLIRIEDV